MNSDTMSGVQEQLVRRIRAVLNRELVCFDEEEGSTGTEPYATFLIRTRSDAPLKVELTVLGDQFNGAVNDASFILSLGAYRSGQEQDWINMCELITESLISGDLRIRLRRTPFGERVGAVWISGGKDSQGEWSGHALACLGGEEFQFPYPWFQQTQ